MRLLRSALLLQSSKAPLPAFCLKALRMRRAQQTADRNAAGELWQDTRGLVFTTKYGTPIEPGNLTRMFALRARRAGLRVIPLRNTRHTCSSRLSLSRSTRGGPAHPPALADRDDDGGLRGSERGEVRAALGKLSAAMGGSGTD
jgi:hypothetical protein